MSYRKKENNYDHNVKILMIGDSGVGKTNIMLKFVDDRFSTSFITTIGIDFKTKNVKMGDKTLRLQIWDTAGQERFRSITCSYFTGADMIILVYDICDEKSFENIEYWIETIKSHNLKLQNCILVGNKIDRKESRVVSFEMASNLAKLHKINYIESSAKMNINISEIFEKICEMYINGITPQRKHSMHPIKPKPIEQQQKCCSIL
jgi:Ras-related protein Rab-8A